MSIVEAQQVAKSFGSHVVLRNMSLSIEQGQVVGLLGTNGAGKSTLIKCLLGLLKVDTGQVKLFGQASWDLSAQAKARLGYVPQEAKFYNWMQVRQVIDYWGSFDENWDKSLVSELCDRWQLPLLQRVGSPTARYGGYVAIRYLAVALNSPSCLAN